MDASQRAAAVRDLAAPVVADRGLVLEDLTLAPAGRRTVLRVVVDLPDDEAGGVPLDAVADASQALSQVLDGSDVMGASPYVLEVSSPGVDRPLTRRRHWSRARGRLVRVATSEGPEVAGRLAAVDDDGVALEDGTRLPWEAVRRGRVEVEFSRPGEEAGDAGAGEG